MKKIIAILTLSVVFALCLSTTVFGAVRVSGYYRSNGTYVKSYYRTAPNSYFYDNYSTYGNYNPYTHKWGTKKYKY